MILLSTVSGVTRHRERFPGSRSTAVKDGTRLIVALMAIALAGGGFALAQDQEDAAGVQAGEVTAEASDTEIGSETEEARRQKFSGEITVTSTRRELEVREVPAAVSVTEGWELESVGATTMDDYAQQVPGVNYIDDNPQKDSVTMRGITTATYSNISQQPVGTYINEIPVTDTFEAWANFDILPFDLERVEFLKGPQGTLYGAASLGGTVRYILNRPNLDRNQGALHLTASSTASGGTNYLAQGMFNAVLADGRFALRGVVSHEDDAGWINHATRGENYNSYVQTSGRLMAAWAVSDTVRIDVTYLYQHSDVKGNRLVSSPDFDDPYVTDISAKNDSLFDQSVANFTLSWDLGFADLMASSSYMTKDWEVDQIFGPGQSLNYLTGEEVFLGLALGLPVEIGDISSQIGLVPYFFGPADASTFSQEFRLVSRDTGTLDWIAGLYYADAHNEFDSTVFFPGMEDIVNSYAPGLGSALYPDDVWLLWSKQGDATELAVYGELGIDLSSEWKLTAGGRYTDFERSEPLAFSIYGNTMAIDEDPFTMNVFSPKVSLSYRPTSDLLWYALTSRGYRTGGINVSYVVGNPDPLDEFRYYDTDNLWNYETGIKKSWAGGRVTTDVSLFYLDWTDIQLDAQFFDPRVGLVNAVFNTGKAHSLGIEAAISAQLGQGFTFTTAIMWNEAEIDEDTPPLVNNETGDLTVVQAGSRLPASPEWSTATTLQYLWNNRSLGYPYVALDHFYKDSYVTYLVSQRGVPSYSLYGLRIGATVARDLQVTLAVRNLTDERTPITYSPGADGAWVPDVIPQTWTITRPRTIALTIQKNF